MTPDISSSLERLLNRPEVPWILEWLQVMGLRKITITIDNKIVSVSATSGGQPFVTSIERQISLATLEKEQ